MDAAPLDDNALSPLSRAIEMVKLRKQNWLIREIADCYKVSERTVYRSLSLHKAAEVVGSAAPLDRHCAAPASDAAIREGDIKP